MSNSDIMNLYNRGLNCELDFSKSLTSSKLIPEGIWLGRYSSFKVAS